MREITMEEANNALLSLYPYSGDDPDNLAQNDIDLVQAYIQQLQQATFLQTWILIKSAGGAIRVPKLVILEADPKTAIIEQCVDPETGDTIFIAR